MHAIPVGLCPLNERDSRFFKKNLLMKTACVAFISRVGFQFFELLVQNLYLNFQNTLSGD